MSTNAGPFTYPHPYTGQIMDATTGQPYVPPTPAPTSMSDLQIDATTTAQDLRRAARLIERSADALTHPVTRANLLSTLGTIHRAAALIDTLASLEEE